MPIPLVGPALAPTLPFPEFAAAQVQTRAHPATANSAQRWGSYTVRAGDTLLALALSRGTSVEEIVARSGLSGSHATLRPGQTLRLPGGSGSPARRQAVASDRSGDGTHVVRPGQTLSGIAQRHGVSPNSLRRANGLTSDLIRPGQRLTVPQGRDRARTRATAARSAAAGTHTISATVRPGDGLLLLASRYGVSRASILKANNLPPSVTLQAGQRLRIVGTRVPGAAPNSSRLASSAEANRAHLARRDLPSRPQIRALIGKEARRQGVDPVLAVAIGWQESRWSQRAVSEANAIGVMQCLPSTGSWVSGQVGRELDLLDTHDNITCGVALLRSLNRSARTQDEVIAAYYQGLTSVRERGHYQDTRRYVRQVRATMARLSRS